MAETRSNDFKRFGFIHPLRGGITFALAAGALLLSPLVTFQAFSEDNIPKVAPPLPEPPRLACQREAHGESWEDPFCGLRDEACPEIKRQEILDYIEAENAHYDAYFERHQGLTDKLYNEFLSRLAWTNATPLVKDWPFYYFTRWGSRLSFTQYLRRHIKSGREELLLDSGERAEKFGQINVGMVLHSPDHNLAAWSEDDDGSEHYTIRVRRIADGETLGDVVPNTSGQIVWAADSSRFFYLELGENSRPQRVRSHKLGAPTGSDPVLFEEADSRYLISIRSSQSGKYLFIELDGLVSTETWFLPTSDPTGKPRLIAERRGGHEYFIDEAGGSFYIRTNDKHPNFRIVRTPV
ncbi:MAG: hypothetical protein V3R73_00590 [Sphingomonadales bacterium]